MNSEADYKTRLIAKHAGKSGMRGKINAKCIECIYDPFAEGTWRGQVKDCTATSCPLFSVRPVPSASAEE